MIEVFDFEQGSEAWKKARCGIPTASRFADILAKGEGKMRRKYLYELAGEIMTGEPAESFSNGHMDRGKEMEDEARKFYAFVTGQTTQRVGFVRNGSKGCSPDSFVGTNRALEIKTKFPHLLIEAILRDDVPPEHKAQCQGTLWVCERELSDICCYWPKMPPLIKTAPRDETYIKRLETEVGVFVDDVGELVDRLRGDPDKLRRQLADSVLLAG
jgi:hypothetical protein